MLDIEQAVAKALRIATDRNTGCRDLLKAVKSFTLLKSYILRIANLFCSATRSPFASTAEVLSLLGIEWMREKVELFCRQYQLICKACHCRDYDAERLAWHGANAA